MRAGKALNSADFGQLMGSLWAPGAVYVAPDKLDAREPKPPPLTASPASFIGRRALDSIGYVRSAYHYKFKTGPRVPAKDSR